MEIEEIAPDLLASDVEKFDIQLNKWEIEFDSWIIANRSYRGTEPYQSYVQQHDNIRRKLLQRRNELIKKKRLEQETPRLDDKSIDALKKIFPNKIGPVIRNSELQGSLTNEADDPESFDDYQPTSYDCARPRKTEATKKQPTESFDCTKPDRSPTVCVPLDIFKATEPGEKYKYLPPAEPPPMPEFKSIQKRVLVDIDTILDLPGRTKRPENLMILIRGAPGSGKSFLADLIVQKELSMGNNRIATLSMNRYYQGKFDPKQLDKFNEQLLNDVRIAVREGICNMIIVECEGGRSLHINKYIHCGITMGHFRTFVIEIRQPLEVCLKYNCNGRSEKDIAEAIMHLDQSPPPAKPTLLDPTSLLLKPQKPANNASVPQVKELSDTEALAKEFSNLLNNVNVKEFLLSMASGEKSSGTPLASPFFDELPTFSVSPSQRIEYNHVHKITPDERILALHVYRKHDHKHQPNPKVKEFIKDIDIDAIIEKRKSDALRKKVIKNLKLAARVEDTVSNPNYPKNWEVISKDRPRLKNKRSKPLTPKIVRVLANKKENLPTEEMSELEIISEDSFDDCDIEMQ